MKRSSLLLVLALILTGCSPSTASISTPTKVSPTPTAVATATKPLVTPTPASLAVGNTDGQGVYVRAQPGGDKVKAWPDGTLMTVIGPDQTVNGAIWKNVKAPDGNVGWVPGQYLGATPTVVAMAAPAVPKPTATQSPSSTSSLSVPASAAGFSLSRGSEIRENNFVQVTYYPSTTSTSKNIISAEVSINLATTPSEARAKAVGYAQRFFSLSYSEGSGTATGYYAKPPYESAGAVAWSGMKYVIVDSLLKNKVADPNSKDATLSLARTILAQ